MCMGYKFLWSIFRMFLFVVAIVDLVHDVEIDDNASLILTANSIWESFLKAT